MRMVLEQRQMLKMVMTTELRQAIELLQLSTYELMQFIHKQAEENPFIELVEREEFTPDYRNRSPRMGESDSQDPIDFTADNSKTFHDYLLEQTIDFELNEEENNIIKYLILNIDGHGYLTVSDEEVCKHFNVDNEVLRKAKEVIHQLEPAGIGAGNLSECLLIQAQRYYPDNELLCTLIQDYLQQLADKQWDKISKELNISLAAVKEIFDTIQTFDPKPAAGLSDTRIEYVRPDIFIEKNDKKNTFTVSLNDYYLPEIRYNHQYSNQLMQSKELSQYVDQHFKKYEWLQNSIEQRRSTILKIMEVIINRQNDFLNDGLPSSLKPLTLKEVADEIEMHESTVSRATANKIVETPTGTFELRYLFSRKLSTKSGNDASQTKVKSILQKLIDNEDKYKPLSDQKIADQLKVEGIVISRRTVAKYRDELNIPSSSRRKEIKV